MLKDKISNLNYKTIISKPIEEWNQFFFFKKKANIKKR